MLWEMGAGRLGETGRKVSKKEEKHVEVSVPHN